MLTAVFNVCFVDVIAGNADWGTPARTTALAASSAIVKFTMPALGAYADLRAAQKRLLVLSTVGCVLVTALLALKGPGDLWLAVFSIIVSNLCYTYGEALIAAFPPRVSCRSPCSSRRGSARWRPSPCLCS